MMIAGSPRFFEVFSRSWSNDTTSSISSLLAKSCPILRTVCTVAQPKWRLLLLREMPGVVGSMIDIRGEGVRPYFTGRGVVVTEGRTENIWIRVEGGSTSHCTCQLPTWAGVRCRPGKYPWIAMAASPGA